MMCSPVLLCAVLHGTWALAAAISPLERAMQLARAPNGAGLAEAEVIYRKETSKSPPTPSAYVNFAVFLRMAKRAPLVEIAAVVKEGLRREGSAAASKLAQMHVELAGEGLMGAKKDKAVAKAFVDVLKHSPNDFCGFCQGSSRHAMVVAKAAQALKVERLKADQAEQVAEALMCCGVELDTSGEPGLSEVVLAKLLNHFLGAALFAGDGGQKALPVLHAERVSRMAKEALNSLQIAQSNIFGGKAQTSPLLQKGSAEVPPPAYERLVATWEAQRRIAGEGPGHAAEWRAVLREREQKLVGNDLILEDTNAAKWRETLFDGIANCPRVAAQALTPDSFKQQFVDASQAVVITGLHQATEAWREFVRRLPELLEGRELAVDVPVGSDSRLNMLVARNGAKPLGSNSDINVSYAEHLSQRAAQDVARGVVGDEDLSPLLTVRPYSTSMASEDFFRVMQRPDLLPRGVRPYLHQTDIGKLLSHKPELVRQRTAFEPVEKNTTVPPLPAFAAAIAPQLFWRNLWLSPKGLQTDSHFDPEDSLLMVVEGEKDLLLWPPTAFWDLNYRQQSQLFPEQIRPREIMNKLSGGPESDGSKANTFPWRFGKSFIEAAQRPPFDYQLALRSRSSGSAASQEYERAREWILANGCRAAPGPGEALFVPVFWTHAVHGQNDSPVAQVNLWFERPHELDAAIAAYQRGKEARMKMQMKMSEL